MVKRRLDISDRTSAMPFGALETTVNGYLANPSTNTPEIKLPKAPDKSNRRDYLFRGNLTINRVPFPTSLSKPMVPPWASTNRLTTAKPKP
jgi:hypothetical protein